MSGRSSPINGGYEGAGLEPAMRLSVRKDLFPDIRVPKLLDPEVTAIPDNLDDISCVMLETDFEQSIDEIANKKQQLANGAMLSPARSRHRKHKHRRDSQQSTLNGSLPVESKRRKGSPSGRKHKKSISNSTVPVKVKGGKNLNLVSSSECQDEDDDDEEEQEEVYSSEDEVLKCSVKLPIINAPRHSGKPYSHELSQLSTKKSKKDSKERRTHAITPCSGKPRSMLDIRSSRSKKKSKKTECSSLPIYHSQIVDTNTIKIKIRRTSNHEKSYQLQPPPASTFIADLGQRKSKKKRAASPVASESSGEEYDPTRGDTAAAMSVAAPKPRNLPKVTKSKKTNTSKSKGKIYKNKKTETTRVSTSDAKEVGPQSPWGLSIPEEILVKIFENVVSTQGTLPSVIRLGRVCKLWHSVSCRPQLWRNVDLAQYTSEKCKTDYKLVWLLENRLSQCQSLNIAQWKVCNISWVLACIVDYCPGLVDLSVAGWSRLSSEQLFDLMQGLSKLRRLDLSLTSETGGSSTCLSAVSVARIATNFGERLTHLTLANNKFTALPQILASIAAHCPNLEVLDISGALATSHPASVPLEALQKGCPKMRVFRAANSQLVLANATTSQQMEAGGWTQLEELSIAGEAAAERVGVGEYRLNDDALSRLVREATRLRLLDLRGLQRLTDSGLVRVPAWDLQHLFLGGCNVTRQSNACLELICQKWSHSLIELDLSWASAERALDDAVHALADSTNSKLRILNLCGSSVSLEPVKRVLQKCTQIDSLNLSSCRALPRGMKRHYTGKELQDLKDSFDPEKVKAKALEEENRKKKNTKKSDSTVVTPKHESTETSVKLELTQDQSSTSTSMFQEPKSMSESPSVSDKPTVECGPKSSPATETSKNSSAESVPDVKSFRREQKLAPPPQSRPDSSSTPRSELGKTDLGSPHYSPVAKPDSQVQNSPELQSDSFKSNNSWNFGQYKTTPPQKSEASPLGRHEMHSKIKQSKVEQCSPTTSQENKPSPEAIKQDIKTSNSWNYGNYSPMPRQDGQFSSQRSPYSAQPSPAQPSPYSAQPSPAQPSPYSAQPSPYSTQPSPYSTQPSPYSSQPSPYSAQPSPDTSQIVKPELQKSGGWNTGGYSPMPKQPAPFSPHPSPEALLKPQPPTQPPAGWERLPQLPAAVERLVWGEAWAPPPDPWALGQFRVEPPHAPADTFVEQSVTFDPASGQLAAFLEDAFSAD